jgi:hypothetical protein
MFAAASGRKSGHASFKQISLDDGGDLSALPHFDDGQSVRFGLEHYALTTARKANPGSRLRVPD